MVMRPYELQLFEHDGTEPFCIHFACEVDARSRVAELPATQDYALYNQVTNEVLDRRP